MVSPEEKTAQETSDRFQIREVIEAYFNAVDRHDMTALGACFAEDAQVTYRAGTSDERVESGRGTIVDFIAVATAKNQSSNHAASSIAIRLQGERADAITFSIVHLVTGGRILVRGLRYDDELAKRGGRWLFLRRRHHPLWQYEAPAPSFVTEAR